MVNPALLTLGPFTANQHLSYRIDLSESSNKEHGLAWAGLTASVKTVLVYDCFFFCRCWVSEIRPGIPLEKIPKYQRKRWSNTNMQFESWSYQTRVLSPILRQPIPHENLERYSPKKSRSKQASKHACEGSSDHTSQNTPDNEKNECRRELKQPRI